MQIQNVSEHGNYQNTEYRITGVKLYFCLTFKKQIHSAQIHTLTSVNFYVNYMFNKMVFFETRHKVQVTTIRRTKKKILFKRI